MWLRIKILLLLIILGVIGIGPVPTTSLICIYLLIFRPLNFKMMVDEVYQLDGSTDMIVDDDGYIMTRIITLCVLVVLAISDLGPVPTVSLICIYAVIFRPLWFKSLVDRIYAA